MLDQTDYDIVYADERPELDEVVELFRAAEVDGPRRPVDDEHRITNIVSQPQQFITARHEGRLIGLLRVLTDFTYNAYVADLVVHPDYRSQGIAKTMFVRATDPYPDVKFVVNAYDPASFDFMLKLGWKPAERAVVLDRRR